MKYQRKHFLLVISRAGKCQIEGRPPLRQRKHTNTHTRSAFTHTHTTRSRSHSSTLHTCHHLCSHLAWNMKVRRQTRIMCSPSLAHLPSISLTHTCAPIAVRTLIDIGFLCCVSSSPPLCVLSLQCVAEGVAGFILSSPGGSWISPGLNSAQQPHHKSPVVIALPGRSVEPELCLFSCRLHFLAWLFASSCSVCCCFRLYAANVPLFYFPECRSASSAVPGFWSPDHFVVCLPSTTTTWACCYLALLSFVKSFCYKRSSFCLDHFQSPEFLKQTTTDTMHLPGITFINQSRWVQKQAEELTN